MVMLFEGQIGLFFTHHPTTHAQMEKQAERVGGGKADQSVFGPALHRFDGLSSDPLAQTVGKWEPHIGAAQQQSVQSLPFEKGTQSTDDSFNFGQFGHLAADTCAGLKSRLCFSQQGLDAI